MQATVQRQTASVFTTSKVDFRMKSFGRVFFADDASHEKQAA